MACRRIPSARHMQAAKLLVDGESGYRALRQAGYSHWSSRNFGLVLRHSWGLREAIRLEQERRREYLVPRPARRRRDKYSRRAVSNAVRQYVAADIQASSSNTFLRKLYAEGKRAQGIAERQTLIPRRCSVCRGPLEGKDRWCPNCHRMETAATT